MMVQKKRKKKKKRSGKSSFEIITNLDSRDKELDQMKSKKLREYLSHKIDLKPKQHLNSNPSVRSLQNQTEVI